MNTLTLNNKNVENPNYDAFIFNKKVEKVVFYILWTGVLLFALGDSLDPVISFVLESYSLDGQAKVLYFYCFSAWAFISLSCFNELIVAAFSKPIKHTLVSISESEVNKNAKAAYTIFASIIFLSFIIFILIPSLL